MKKKMRIPQKFQLGMRGVSLVEVLVAAAMIAGLGITLATIQQQAAESNRAAALQQTAQDLKARMLAAVSDQRAWDATLLDTTVNTDTTAVPTSSPERPLHCVRYQRDCSAVTAATPFTLFDSTGAVLFSNVASGATNARGFDARGAVCNTFNDTATGDTTCVFSTRVSRTILCPGTPCYNPQINITINLLYRPYNGKAYANLDLNKYSLVGFVRGAKALTKTFSLAHQITGAAGVGGGNCDGASGTVNRNWTASQTTDPFALVTVNYGTGVVTFNNPAGIGTYKCRATGNGFGVGGFTINLKKSSTVLGTGSAIAKANPDWLQATASLDTIFTVQAGDTVVLEQVCENPNWGVGGWAGAQNFALGLGISPYGATTLATLICSRLN